jgi:hypothetical protein
MTPLFEATVDGANNGTIVIAAMCSRLIRR